MLGPPPPLPFDASVLRTAGELSRLSRQPRTAKTQLHQVRHGVWVDRRVWVALDGRGRHEAKAHATALMARPDRPPVFCETSAAAVWGMPRVEPWPGRSNVSTRTGHARTNGSVVRRVDADLRPVARHGLLVTSAARTVVDLALSSSLPSAVAAADHALRHGLCTAADLVAEANTVEPGARNRSLTSLVTDLADGRSMSAGESLSRVQMYLLHLPRPDLQVEVRDDEGLIGYGDFGWERTVGEFDGKVKYRVPADATAEQAAEVLWQEKRREDRIRRRGHRVARWVWSDALDPRSLLAILEEVGIRPLPRQRWFDLAAIPSTLTPHPLPATPDRVETPREHGVPRHDRGRGGAGTEAGAGERAQSIGVGAVSEVVP